MCIPRGGHPYPVYNSVIKEDAMRECTQRNKYDTNKGLFYVQTIYPIALMKQANLDNFIQQVAEVRLHEKKFWNEGRSKEELNQKYNPPASDFENYPSFLRISHPSCSERI